MMAFTRTCRGFWQRRGREQMTLGCLLKAWHVLPPSTLAPERYLACEEVDDLEGMLDDAHSHELLAIVAAVHHHGVGEPLHDGALCFAEPLGSIAPCAMGQVLGVLLFHCNVILGRGAYSQEVCQAPATHKPSVLGDYRCEPHLPNH